MIRQIGKVVPPAPEQIEWEDGHRERVRLDQMPGEFVTYKPGQTFEAIVVPTRGFPSVESDPMSRG